MHSLMKVYRDCVFIWIPTGKLSQPPNSTLFLQNDEQQRFNGSFWRQSSAARAFSAAISQAFTVCRRTGVFDDFDWRNESTPRSRNEASRLMLWQAAIIVIAVLARACPIVRMNLPPMCRMPAMTCMFDLGAFLGDALIALLLAFAQRLAWFRPCAASHL